MVTTAARRVALVAAAASALAASLVAGTASPSDAATTGTSTTPIPISGSGNAAPYPSPIVVSGLTGTVTSVTVTLNDVSHLLLDEVGVAVMAPDGHALMLMDGVGNDGPSSHLTLTFSDAAPAHAADTGLPASGTFKPTAWYSGDSFPVPGPLLAYDNPGPILGGTATLASAFNGRNPNGTWNLFVREFAGGDAGSIAGGWSITIATANDVGTPTVTGVSPASGSTSTTVHVTGSAESGSTVSLYGSPDCGGAALASGAAADFATTGLPVTVAPASTTTFYAKATKAGKNASGCSSTSASYHQVPPTPDTTLTRSPAHKVTTAKRKVKVAFSFSSTVTGSTFTCTLDGHASACTSGQAFKVRPGRHSFSVVASAAGATDPTPATYAFKVKHKKGKG